MPLGDEITSPGNMRSRYGDNTKNGPDIGGEGLYDFGPAIDQETSYTVSLVEDPCIEVVGLAPGDDAPADAATVAVFQMAEKQLRVVVSWVVRRTGAKPIIPSKTPRDDNLIFLGAALHPEQLTPSLGGEAQIYVLSGSYTYIARDITKVKVSYPVPPGVDRPFLPDPLGVEIRDDDFDNDYTLDVLTTGSNDVFDYGD